MTTLSVTHKWKQKVVGTFSRIIEVNDGGYGLSIAVNEKKETIFFAPDALNNPFFMRTYFVLIEEVEKVETAAYKDRLGIIERLIRGHVDKTHILYAKQIAT
ncbi:hypothetical protein MKZ23_31195 [Paenibacillus sp. FSL R5-0876]|uniref:hypothetical protein n=1 Tax=Paenibacillus TaxID=44249 RepID=UPI0015C340F5|nr:hypothetical protein [Paenibacillus odorifer]